MTSFKMKNMTLIDLSESSSGVIVGFVGDPDIAGRLREVGIYSGVQVEMIGKAPFGGPRIYRFDGSVLALRDEEAACVAVKPLLKS